MAPRKTTRRQRIRGTPTRGIRRGTRWGTVRPSRYRRRRAASRSRSSSPLSPTQWTSSEDTGSNDRNGETTLESNRGLADEASQQLNRELEEEVDQSESEQESTDKGEPKGGEESEDIEVGDADAEVSEESVDVKVGEAAEESDSDEVSDNISGESSQDEGEGDQDEGGSNQGEGEQIEESNSSQDHGGGVPIEDLESEAGEGGEGSEESGGGVLIVDLESEDSEGGVEVEGVEEGPTIVDLQREEEEAGEGEEADRESSTPVERDEVNGDPTEEELNVPLRSFDSPDSQLGNRFHGLPAELQIATLRYVDSIKCTARRRGPRNTPSRVCPHQPPQILSNCRPNSPDRLRTPNSAGLNHTPGHNPCEICDECFQDTTNSAYAMEANIIAFHHHPVCGTCRAEELALNDDVTVDCICLERIREYGHKCHACRYDALDQTQERAERHERRLHYVWRTNDRNRVVGPNKCLLNPTNRHWSADMRCRCGRKRSKRDYEIDTVMFCTGCRGVIVNLGGELGRTDVNDRKWTIYNQKYYPMEVPHET